MQEKRQGSMQEGFKSERGREEEQQGQESWDLEQVGMWCGWSRCFYGYEWTVDVKDLPLMVLAA